MFAYEPFTLRSRVFRTRKPVGSSARPTTFASQCETLLELKFETNLAKIARESIGGSRNSLFLQCFLNISHERENDELEQHGLRSGYRVRHSSNPKLSKAVNQIVIKVL